MTRRRRLQVTVGDFDAEVAELKPRSWSIRREQLQS
jgi:hypothetical protein